MTHEQFITLETAKLAKQAGFDWEVYSCYYKSSPDRVSTNGTLTSNFNGYAFQHIAISAPTQSVLQRWLRELHNLIVVVKPYYGKKVVYGYIIYQEAEGFIKIIDDGIGDRSYESTLEAGLKKCLTLII